ncbi:MAG: alpha/beta hydrolase [Armatimonadetes bacterium]|nr:alpha/beta hydrolase [Armatimonadota bacterium]
MKTPFRIWPFLLCCIASGSIGAKFAPRAQAQGAPLPVQRNLVYGEAGGQKLLLDVYGANRARTRPAVILVHGGSWSSGSKADLGFVASALARQGYVGFSVNYRLLRDGRNRFPAQLDDVQRAVRWVRAHAREFGVDPQRIGALGASAGGHLAALLGTTDTRDNSDRALARYSSRVQCVVDLYGPTDFTAALDLANRTRMRADQSPGAGIVQGFLGPLPAAAANYRLASPVTHINRKTAPFLIFHGGRDTLVPLNQSQRLHRALRAAGVESKLVVFPAAGHGYSEPELLAQTFIEVQRFFARHLAASIGASL